VTAKRVKEFSSAVIANVYLLIFKQALLVRGKSLETAIHTKGLVQLAANSMQPGILGHQLEEATLTNGSSDRNDMNSADGDADDGHDHGHM
jgi:hypothetical protein